MSDLLIFIVLFLRPLKFPSRRGSCKIDQAYLTLDGLPIIKSSRPEVFLKKAFWKYAADLKENTRAEVWFQ